MQETICTSQKCPKKEKCYRFRDIENPFWEVWQDFYNEKEKCDYFISRLAMKCKDN